MATQPATGVPEVITITAPADPCSYVYDGETAAQKNAGGTFADNARYHLCRAGMLLKTASQKIVAWFVDEFAAAWAWLKRLWNAPGDALRALVAWAQDLYNRIKAAIAAEFKNAALVFAIVGIGAFVLLDEFLTGGRA
jgi:hypothetical protein